MTSIDRNLDNNDNDGEFDPHEQSYDPSLPPLDRRILDVVKSCPDRIIRPAKLATDLGISVNDACAELCGLLSAVGGGTDGASFVFEMPSTTVTNTEKSGHVQQKVQPTMVFTFPPDFESRALRNRRKEDWNQSVQNFVEILVKIVKIITAFGLVLSLLIISVAIMLSIVAVIIGISRTGGGNHDHHRSALMYRLRSMFFTMRQLLWCYAVFGGNMEGQDPFLREIAMDLSLFMSICCGNPGSFFFWYRTNLLSNRRRRYTRGWGEGNFRRPYGDSDNMEGVSLIQRGSWGHDNNDNDDNTTIAGPDEHRGILSVAVEFLFGPTPFYLGPDEAEKWKMRGALIMKLSSNSNDGSMSLYDLSPYIDYPGDRVSGALAITTHFNGVPAANSSGSHQDDDAKEDSTSSPRFVFPELLAESSISSNYTNPANMDDGSWESLLYKKEFVALSGRSSENTFPSYLIERRYVLTKLQRSQFIYCSLLGALNFIGVIWMSQSLQPGGALADIGRVGFLFHFTKNVLLPMLSFYSYLFWGLVAGRFLVILVLNAAIARRNKKRSEFADALQ